MQEPYSHPSIFAAFFESPLLHRTGRWPSHIRAGEGDEDQGGGGGGDAAFREIVELKSDEWRRSRPVLQGTGGATPPVYLTLFPTSNERSVYLEMLL